MDRKPVLLDGSTGSVLWSMAEVKGIEKVPVWKYNIEEPEMVLLLHRSYIDAGSRIILTNTFSANRESVAHSSDYTVSQVVRSAVELAIEASAGTDVKVALDLGPLSQLLEPYGRLTKADTSEIYTELCTEGVKAGAELIALETFMDLEMMKLAAAAAKETGLPFICSMTFGKRGRTMMGDSVEKIIKALEPLEPMAVGMNCSAGPVEALPVIREFASKTALPLYFKPNSGIGATYSADDFARELEPALPLVSFVGGCCGCGADYIRAISEKLHLC